MHTAHEAAKEAAFIRSHGRAVLIATGIDARANRRTMTKSPTREFVATAERTTATAPRLRLRRRIRVRHRTALDRARGDTISGKNGVTMNHLVAVGLVFLLAALLVALDGSLALRAMDRLVQSEGYTDIQNMMTVTNATIRF
jgi:hypothetical protein